VRRIRSSLPRARGSHSHDAADELRPGLAGFALGLDRGHSLNDPYVPAVFTLFPDLTIHRAYDGYWFWGRPTTDELRRDMREITTAIRADWAAPAA
jgi:hypothetical protein